MQQHDDFLHLRLTVTDNEGGRHQLRFLQTHMRMHPIRAAARQIEPVIHRSAGRDGLLRQRVTIHTERGRQPVPMHYCGHVGCVVQRHVEPARSVKDQTGAPLSIRNPEDGRSLAIHLDRACANCQRLTGARSPRCRVDAQTCSERGGPGKGQKVTAVDGVLVAH